MNSIVATTPPRPSRRIVHALDAIRATLRSAARSAHARRTSASYQTYLLRERKTAAAHRCGASRRPALLLREDAEAAVSARRHAVSESPAAAAPDPECRGGGAGDRRRRQSVAPHDADGPVLDRHAERGAAPSAGRRHRQPADADSHPTRQRGTRSLRPAEPHAADDAARVLPVDAAEDLAVSRNR